MNAILKAQTFPLPESQNKKECVVFVAQATLYSADPQALDMYEMLALGFSGTALIGSALCSQSPFPT